MSEEKHVPHHVVCIGRVVDATGTVCFGTPREGREFVNQAVRCAPFADQLADAVDAVFADMCAPALDDLEVALAAYRAAQKGE